MPVVMGAMVVIMGLTLVAYSAASGDLGGSRKDQDYKRAYSAAEAGVNEYLFRLNSDEAYWTKCTNVPAPTKVSQRWDGVGTDVRKHRTIPGTDASYTIELLPVAASCSTSDSTTMIDTKTGTFRIRSTGFVRGTKRSIIATFRRVGFLDFLYYTDLETTNPVSYKINAGGYPAVGKVGGFSDVQAWATAKCGKPFEQRDGAAVTFNVQISSRNQVPVDVTCTEVNFATGDGINGPLHTNDQMLICGTPAFGRNVDGVRDQIQVVNKAGWRPNKTCSGSSPNLVGEPRFGAPRLDAPPVVSLKAIADESYRFSGRTVIELSGTTLTVNGVSRVWPPNGVIYVQHGSGTCSGFYDPTKTESSQAACGDVEVKGTYAKDLTIAAEKDIKVTGNITQVPDSNSMLGLIAQNFIRVQHKVNSLTPSYDSSNDVFNWSCSNVSGWPTRIDAAMLAIDHSFTVDNYYCGSQLGALTINGAIAQKYRGTVGLVNTSGYAKNYVYDDRLRYRQPPFFLDPIQTGWRVIRQTEQTPAR